MRRGCKRGILGWSSPENPPYRQCPLYPCPRVADAHLPHPGEQCREPRAREALASLGRAPAPQGPQQGHQLPKAHSGGSRAPWGGGLKGLSYLPARPQNPQWLAGSQKCQPCPWISDSTGQGGESERQGRGPTFKSRHQGGAGQSWGPLQFPGSPTRSPQPRVAPASLMPRLQAGQG